MAMATIPTQNSTRQELIDYSGTMQARQTGFTNTAPLTPELSYQYQEMHFETANFSTPISS